MTEPAENEREWAAQLFAGRTADAPAEPVEPDPLPGHVATEGQPVHSPVPDSEIEMRDFTRVLFDTTN